MNKRSAHPLNFGIDFQVNAAIVLMLENIEDLSTLRLEGKEDIEIKLNDDSYILAQAKSVENSNTDFHNVRANLKKSLETLSEAANQVGNVNRLIYITNSPNPIKEEESRPLFYGHAHWDFNDLPDSTKGIINGYLSQINNRLDTNLLSIHVLPFATSNDREKYKVVWMAISDFLENVGFPELRLRLHEVWSNSVFRNGSRQEEEIKITKKDIIWPIIVCITDNRQIYKDETIMATLDDGEYDIISRKYEGIINYCTERFEFVTSVISDYNAGRVIGRDAITRFVDERWMNYKDEFEFVALDDGIKEKLIKIILCIILKRRYDINDIKQKVKL